MPSVTLKLPIRDLIPIELSAGPSQDKGKGKAVDVLIKGKLERERSVSLTMSEFEGVWHGGKSSAFVYSDSSIMLPLCYWPFPFTIVTVTSLLYQYIYRRSIACIL
jgi:hypothetical protein